MPSALTADQRAEAEAFADSIAGRLGRVPGAPAAWTPGTSADDPRGAAIAAALAELGWSSVFADPELIACAGLGAIALGRHQAPLEHIDGILGGAPTAGSLVRWRVAGDLAVWMEDGVAVRARVARAERRPSADGLDVWEVLELGAVEPVDETSWRAGVAAWLAASVGYLAGIGEGALDLTVEYVRQRRAFDTTLAALGPVQQHLARAAAEVRGVRLLAGAAPGTDALAYAGPAVADACAACQQVTGAIGYTLEYPLHGFTQRARALSAWNDALIDVLVPAAVA